jgi:hypothetical protein
MPMSRIACVALLALAVGGCGDEGTPAGPVRDMRSTAEATATARAAQTNADLYGLGAGDFSGAASCTPVKGSGTSVQEFSCVAAQQGAPETIDVVARQNRSRGRGFTDELPPVRSRLVCDAGTGDCVDPRVRAATADARP